MIILVFVALGIALVYMYLSECKDNDLYEAADESCYYCKHSRQYMRLRDKDKNTCNVVDNTGWSSEQIKECPFREKYGVDKRKGFFDYLFDWIYYGTDDYFYDIINYIKKRIM